MNKTVYKKTKIKAKLQQPKNVTSNKLSSTLIASSCPPKQYSNNNSTESTRNSKNSSIEYQYVPEAEEAVEAKLKEQNEITSNEKISSKFVSSPYFPQKT